MRRASCLGWSAPLLLSWLLPCQGAVESDVLQLGEGNFAEALGANSLLLVKFYAPWCGHCKQLAPEYEKAATALAGSVQLAEVDATQEASLAERYKIEGYPTLLFFKNGKSKDYGGGRSNESIVSWVQEHSGPALVTISSEAALATMLKQRKSEVPYFVAKGGASLKDIFGKLADEEQITASFIFVEETKASPVIQVHRGFNEIIELDGNSVADGSLEQIRSLLQKEMLPPFGEISEDNFGAYLARAEHGILWICFQQETYKEDAQKHQGVFQRVAASFSQFPVVFINTKTYDEHVREELGCTDFPMAVLQIANFTDEEAETDPKRYKLFLEQISEEAVSSWMTSAVAGEAPQDDGLEDLDEEEEEEMEEEEEEGEEEGSEEAAKLEGSEEAAKPDKAEL